MTSVITVVTVYDIIYHELHQKVVTKDAEVWNFH